MEADCRRNTCLANNERVTMRYTKMILSAAALLATTPAFAQDTGDTSGFSISGTAAVVSDYRFRGFSQTGEEATVQGGFTVSHDTGLYAGVWGSGVSFANGTELDLVGGYKTEVVSGITADVGMTAYFYPGTSDSTILEPYLKVGGSVGPASLTVGFAWAPGGQNSLGDDSAVYFSGDLGVAIPSTPITLTGHMGYAKSDSFLGGLDGDVFDYSIGASVTWEALTLGVAYVNTDAPTTWGYKEGVGADGAAVFSLTAAF